VFVLEEGDRGKVGGGELCGRVFVLYLVLCLVLVRALV